jgi:hypothetical protein
VALPPKILTKKTPLNSLLATKQVSALTKFPGLQISNNLIWKKNIEYIISTLSYASFAVRTVTPQLKADTLKFVHFYFFHLVILYGINFWGNSAGSKRVFIIQKIIRITVSVKRRELFSTLPGSIKSLNHNIKLFMPALKDCLLSHSL